MSEEKKHKAWKDILIDAIDLYFKGLSLMLGFGTGALAILLLADKLEFKASSEEAQAIMMIIFGIALLYFITDLVKDRSDYYRHRW